MIRRLCGAAFVVCAALVVSAAPAAAHASLQGTTPGADEVLEQAPAVVELRFTEPVEAGLGGIRVISPTGGQADSGAVESAEDGAVLRTTVDASDQGTYTVAWSVTSEDGHLIEGSFLFSVGEASSPAELADDGRPGVRFLAAVARAMAFAGTILLIGVVAFQFLVRRRPAKRSVATVAVFGAGLALVGSGLVLVAHVALSSGRPLLDSLSLLSESATSTRFGELAVVRIALALLALILAAAWRLRPTIALLAAIAAPSVVLAVLPAIAGHAWTTTPLGVAIGADVVHLLAVGVWVGGLVALLAHARDEDAIPLAERFSTVALFTVIVVVVTGSVSSYLQVRTLDGIESSYGRLLVIKVVIVSLIVGLASVSRSLLRQAEDRSNVFRVVACEIAVVLAVLGVTSVLVNRPPARASIVQPVSATAEMDGGTVSAVQIQVEPAAVGSNDIHLYFIGGDGLPQPVDVVEVTVASAGVPDRRVEVTPVTPDHVSAYGVNFPTAGRWTLTITAVREGDTSTGELEVEIR